MSQSALMGECRRHRILIVDDDPAFREALHLMLDDDYEVIDASDGVEALTVLASRKIDLMLLDLLMVHGDGFEVLEHTRRDPRKLPIIVLSGLNNAWAAATAMRFGAVDYVTKPFDEDLLRKMIQDTLISSSESPAPIGGLDARKPVVLLMGLDLGVYASLTVLLRPQCRVVRADTVMDALAVPGASSTILVVDVRSLGQAAAILPQLCEHFQNASLVAIGDGRLPAPCTILQTPLRVTELLGVIRGHSTTSFPGYGYSPRVLSVIDHLGTHYAEGSVRRLASLVRSSPDRLSECFRAETGLKLKVYMTQLRIEAAKWLLHQAGEKIDAVAARVGLHDASHLSRLFVRYAGTRPGAYRRIVAPGP